MFSILRKMANNRETVSYINKFTREINEIKSAISGVFNLFQNLDGELYVGTTITCDGNIIPAENNKYSIGDETNHMKNVFVDGAIVFDDELAIGFENNPQLVNFNGFGNVDLNDAMLAINGRHKFEIKNVTVNKGEDKICVKDPNFDNFDISHFLNVGDLITIDERDFRRVTEIIDENTVKLDRDFNFTIVTNLIVYPINLKVNDRFIIDNNGHVGINCLPSNISALMVGGSIMADKFISTTGDLSNGLNSEFLCGKTLKTGGEIVTEGGKHRLFDKVIGNKLDLDNNRIVNVGDPVHITDAANKKYVDEVAIGLNKLKSVRCAMTQLFGNYDGGTITLDNIEDVKMAFDNIFLTEGDFVLVMGRANKVENGIYVYSGNCLTRRSDFTGMIDREVYIFVEEGKKYGGVGFVTVCQLPIHVGESEVDFTMFLGSDVIEAGNGLKRIDKVISLNFDDEYFAVDERGKLMFCDDQINCGTINVGRGLYNNGDSTLKMGSTVDLSVQVDNKTIVVGKYGELRLANQFPDIIKSGDDSYFKGSIIGENITCYDSFRIATIQYPPESIKISLEKNVDSSVASTIEVVYWVSIVNGNSKQTDVVQSNSEYFCSQCTNVFANVEWTSKSGSNYCLYRSIDGKLEYTIIESGSRKTKIVDTIVPRNMCKIKWYPCERLPSHNELVEEKLLFGKDRSFIVDSSLSIGSKNSNGGVLSINNAFKNDSHPLRIEDYGQKHSIFMAKVKDSYLVDSGPTICGVDNRGKSAIRFGNHIDLITQSMKDGAVRICGEGSVSNKNDSLGSYDYRLQVFGGGIYADGNVLCRGMYSTEGNLMGNDAAILKAQNTGGNAAGDAVSFFVNGDQIEIHPMKNGKWNREKAKCFTIDHPVDNDRYLVHACLEGPKADVFYRGKAQFHGYKNWVEVRLPKYFEQLVDGNSVTIQLTAISAKEPDYIWTRGYKDGGFEVCRKNNGAQCDLEFYWEVKASRRGCQFDVEPLKTETVVNNIGPYTWQ